MADQEQLEILKQGAAVWNEWRGKKENIVIKVDLSDANLTEFWLRGVNLSSADLSRAILKGAMLDNAHLSFTDLEEANFRKVSLDGADLDSASLRRANFNGASLGNTSIRGSDLRKTDFSRAKFNGVDLSMSILTGMKLRKATLAYSIFGFIDLSDIIGLETVHHEGPSTIGLETIYNSKGKIPKVFLRGCGLSDLDIEYSKLYSPDLSNEEINKVVYKIYELRATQPIQISPLFISYSHADSGFVDKVESRLNEKGVRFWRDIHDMKSGRMEKQIDRALRLNPTVLLILSEHSLESDWVEHEVRTARALEKELKRDALCPIALDDSWKNSPWAKRIMEQVMEYNILDFSEWKNDAKFENMFNKLIGGLELFYK